MELPLDVSFFTQIRPDALVEVLIDMSDFLQYSLGPSISCLQTGRPS